MFDFNLGFFTLIHSIWFWTFDPWWFQTFSHIFSSMTTNKNSRFDKWAYLDKDVLLRIFMTLNVVDLICGACVCTSWREAASEPGLWKMVDLSKLESRNFNRQPERSSQRVMDILNSAFSLSGGTISCLIFHFYVYITSQHLVLVSERY